MRPVGMVSRPDKGSASNVGRQAAEGSEVAPLWLLWGLGATLRPAPTDAEARRVGTHARGIAVVGYVLNGWRRFWALS